MDTSYYRTLTIPFGVHVLLERYQLYYMYDVSSVEYLRKNNTIWVLHKKVLSVRAVCGRVKRPAIFLLGRCTRSPALAI